MTTRRSFDAWLRPLGALLMPVCADSASGEEGGDGVDREVDDEETADDPEQWVDEVGLSLHDLIRMYAQKPAPMPTVIE